MTALLVASCCTIFATSWAVRELRLAATALNLQPALLRRGWKGHAGELAFLERAMRAEADAWETHFVRALVRARSLEEARAEANAVLMEVDGRLSANTRTYAACARISVFGCLIGAAWLFMAGQGLTTAVVDVFAIGAAGVLSTLAAGKEAKRLVRRKREELDGWVEDLIRASWPDAQGG